MPVCGVEKVCIPTAHSLPSATSKSFGMLARATIPTPSNVTLVPLTLIAVPPFSFVLGTQPVSVVVGTTSLNRISSAVCLWSDMSAGTHCIAVASHAIPSVSSKPASSTSIRSPSSTPFVGCETAACSTLAALSVLSLSPSTRISNSSTGVGSKSGIVLSMI